MGGPKAIMDAGGRPWWRIQENRLAAAGIARHWIVSDEVARALRAEAGAPALLIPADPDAPMFASLRAGIEALPRGASAFILPVDVPAPRAEVWRALAAAAGPAVPVHRRERGHPAALPAGWIDRVLRPAFARGSPDRLDQLLTGAVEIPVDDSAVVTNLNTPDDLSKWLAAGP
jgi:CTP:molybdopterin cytidylyltransferase MocA